LATRRQPHRRPAVRGLPLAPTRSMRARPRCAANPSGPPRRRSGSTAACAATTTPSTSEPRMRKRACSDRARITTPSCRPRSALPIAWARTWNSTPTGVGAFTPTTCGRAQCRHAGADPGARHGVGGRRAPEPGQGHADRHCLELHVDGELRFVGDSNAVEPSEASNRRGYKLVGFWRPQPWLASKTAGRGASRRKAAEPIFLALETASSPAQEALSV
jgi:hypothetical protein